MQKIRQDSIEKAILLSSITFLKPDDGEYVIVSRIQSEYSEPIAEQLNSSGFTVAYVG